ncbi:hypothetical protein CDAR_584291 [Caerostris darwini]|uniref:Uncharacterized protein n=1 Tax=Caerostris darwini TaxID=1538125 RepID=A0AAV4WED4_9ARAC|nr:hypothetical protein CDAR_584291 [Caerostris darwini]
MQYSQTLCWPKQFEESDPNFRPVTLLNSLEGCCSSPCLVNTPFDSDVSLFLCSFLGGLLSHPSREVRLGTGTPGSFIPSQKVPRLSERGLLFRHLRKRWCC